MKADNMKRYLLSIILYGFLVYLFFLYTNHALEFVNSLDRPFLVGMPVFFTGLLIFSEIIKRATDFDVSAFHPVKIVGYISAATVLIILIYLS